VEKNVFNTVTSPTLHYALLCNSSLLIMSAKDKKSEVFSYFWKVKCEFIASSHTLYLNKGLLNTSSHLCWCKCVCVGKNTEKSSVFCALCMVYLAALLAGIVKTATDKACNEWKCSDTNVVFQRAIFLILVVRNGKRFSGIDGKTSDCPSRNFLYYCYLEIPLCQ